MQNEELEMISDVLPLNSTATRCHCQLKIFWGNGTPQA